MNEWRKCTSCKESVGFEAPYWVCNVSTCQKKRAGLVFCSMECWDAHLPVLRHKEAWALERQAPSEAEWAEVIAGEREDPTYPERERNEEVKEAQAPPAPKSSTPAPVIRRRRPE